MSGTSMFDEYYSGSSLLVPLAQKTGLDVDKLNFAVSQLVALITSFLMRRFLHPSFTPSAVRHGFSFIMGLTLSYFCFGYEIGYLLVVTTVCYFSIQFQSTKTMPYIVFVISLGFLGFIHIKRIIYNYGAYNLDITGPLMVMVQRVTQLAFSLHDGLSCDYESLSSYRKQYLTKKKPSILEYYGYTFQFQSILAGPNILFKDYIQFIDGTNFRMAAKKEGSGAAATTEPSAVQVVVQKLVLSFACIGIHMGLSSNVSLATTKGNEFLYEWSGWQQMLYLTAYTTLTRFMYYHAWIMSDAVCNASGLGFNGYDSNGNAKWDLASNVDILGFEFSGNLRGAISSWNTGTNVWLRFLVYERLERYDKTLFTFLLSALWHGFYPGYYVCFTTAAGLVMAARNIRKFIRPLFLGNAYLKSLYDVLTFLTTRLSIAYFTFPFIMYDLWPVFLIYKRMFFYIHVGSLLSIFVLPTVAKKLFKPPPRVEK